MVRCCCRLQALKRNNAGAGGDGISGGVADMQGQGQANGPNRIPPSERGHGRQSEKGRAIKAVGGAGCGNNSNNGHPSARGQY